MSKQIFPVLLFYLCYSLCVAQTGKLTGHIVVNKNDKKSVAAHTSVFLGIGNSRIVFPDKDLNFSLDSLFSGITMLRIVRGLQPDTLIKNIMIEDGKTIHLEITLTPCKYEKSKKDKTCPVCKKKDQSIPIVYGLLVDTGKKTRRKEKEFYTGGCVISGCDPNWYCKRDKRKF
jgi:hypothetical protein